MQDASDSRASAHPDTFVVEPGDNVTGIIEVPGDKSISHRALMLASIADGISHIRGLLRSEDCLATRRAFEVMGVDIRDEADGGVKVVGAGKSGLRKPGATLDMGNSGTAMRLFAGLLAGQSFDSQLTGDESLRQRPMERVAAPLNAMGARITTTGGKPPISIEGGRALKGIQYELPIASAQVKSALLLAGLYASGATVITEPAVTRDHTERMLQTLGCTVDKSGKGVRLVGPQSLRGCQIDVPGDFSSAAFFIVAGCLARGGTLTIRNVGINPTRTGLLRILRLMGADIRVINARQSGNEPVADLQVAPVRLAGTRIPPELVSLAIDEFPVIFVAAACAEGETTVSGAGELRHKESDRIAVMADGLVSLGIAAQVTPDGMVVKGGSLRGGEIHARGDHRIAMAFAVAGMRAAGPIVVREARNIATSFPGFLTLARQAGLRIGAADV